MRRQCVPGSQEKIESLQYEANGEGLEEVRGRGW